MANKKEKTSEKNTETAMIIIGTDEAGYGPNLGPLIVSATIWESPADDLSKLFSPLKSQGIAIGDSKKLYHGGGSLATLEYGILIPLHYLGHSVTPVAAEEKIIAEREKAFKNILHENKVRLLDISYRSIFPEEFNQLLNQFDSKGSLLSDTTMKLVAAAVKAHDTAAPILILCDKHGGRNHYLDLLTEFFPGEFIQAVQECRSSSMYRLTYNNRPIEVRFLAKGESQLPIALASMNSKYHRELAMIDFNNFWQEKIPNLKPTAGYPEDAKRFKAEITAVQKKSGIADDEIWRKK